jgi:hypothetical protein
MRCEAADRGSGETGGLDDLRACEGAGPFDRDVQDTIDVQASEVPGMARTGIDRVAAKRPMGISHFPNGVYKRLDMRSNN